jgi:hypothetical protein
MNKALLMILSCFFAMYCNCTLDPLAGGSSQQGNGMVVGNVVSMSGTPSITTIRIRSTEYVQTHEISTNKDGTYDVKTDSSGHFSISGIDPGTYTIEANDLTSFAALIKVTITEKNDTTNIGTLGLKPYARITGIVEDIFTGEHSPLYIQVPGLERLVQIGQNGTFSIDDLPEGSFNLRIVAFDSTIAPVDVYDIKTTSGNTAPVHILAGWRYSHNIHLNTTTSGANISGNVLNFPVLIRLTAANFDFNQARDNGADIRFTKSNYTSLPFEIERWDAVNKLAEIWVKIDTVHGDDSTQYLTMHWGNLNAPNCSNGTAVFDTSAGFAAVWHLSETSDSAYDATGNAFNGKNFGSTSSTGMVGNSRLFSNGTYIKIPGLLKSPSNITLSAWVKSDTTTRDGQEIISLGDAISLRMDDLNLGTTGSFYTDSINFEMTGSKKYLAKSGWHFVVFSFNSEKQVQTLYIDGVQCAITTYVYPVSYIGQGIDTYIGIHGNGKPYFNLVGQVDEVRVNNIAVTPEWVKLCFMNQKAQNSLVIW